ncbi:hypothetical protein Poli38472_007895 [Pythium oligandrum]|uniref:D-3-phosphoglycerate dehydrogenase n=1 Tax=Pythium oligandrum TaxID=41045 RepID=A0A8K1CSP0_PYTOL|nr:hypothetical protein Poli38472_007895 [Pythium oligandrum]|eukprot:TMW68223.1 hypothetical protein Poli38472_007895 [Pythium oligandrum]
MWRASRHAVQSAWRRSAQASPFFSLSTSSASNGARAVSSSVPVVASERRILCVGVPQSLAESTCVQELTQRGHVVDQLPLQSSTGEVDSAKLASIVGDYDALLVAPPTQLPREILAQGARSKLQLIAVPSLAIDSGLVDVMEATNQGVMLLQLDKKQVGDKFSVEAELAMSLLIQLARHIPKSIATTRSGEAYRREDFTGTELANKNLGIVGLGQAGKRVVEMARAMGLNVLGYDPNLTQEAAAVMGVKRLSLDELYAQSDILAFHAPLTARTRDMFDDAALAKCKDGVQIVSVAEYKGREGLLKEGTLLNGLESGKIAGVALDYLADVESSEDSSTWSHLLAHDRVITRRHLDGKQSDAATEAKKYRAIAENLGDALAQRYYRGVANGVFMPLTLVPEMKPFLDLSEALGRFLFHLTVTNDRKDPITRVSVATCGGVQVDITTPQAKSALQSAVMKGILDCINELRGGNGFGTPRISLLNASLLAMTNGIDVRAGDLTARDATLHLNNSITVQVETRSKEQFLIMGTVFGDDPRVVRINEYTNFPSFRPEGNLLIFKNEDKPGAIAGILKELVAAQINIANFGLSRQPNSDLALGILSLDSTPSIETIEKLKGLSNVESVQFALV